MVDDLYGSGKFPFGLGKVFPEEQGYSIGDSLRVDFGFDKIGDNVEDLYGGKKFPESKDYSLDDALGLDLSADYSSPRDRNDLFKAFGTDTSIIDRGEVDVSVVAGHDFDLYKYESTFGRFTFEEQGMRTLYNERSREIVGMAWEQILPQQAPGREVSVGMKGLLRLAIDYLGGKSPFELEQYASEGCDVAESLITVDGVGLADRHSRQLESGGPLQTYYAENAIRAIRAFVSIAEYERFKGLSGVSRDTKLGGLESEGPLGFVSRRRRARRTFSCTWARDHYVELERWEDKEEFERLVIV
jgi:hypothetical protein